MTIQEPGRGHDFGRTVVPAGNVFVMGDNRDNSSDSRVWGTVQHDLIKGKALIVWWSRAPTESWNLGHLVQVDPLGPLLQARQIAGGSR